MNVRDRVLESAAELSSAVGASAVIIISPEYKAIRKKLKVGVPVLVARLVAEHEEAEFDIELPSKLHKKVSKESLFLKVSRIELMSEAVEAAYMKGLVQEGIVLGVVSVGDIISIVVFNVTDIPLVKRMAELTSLVGFSVIKATLNLALEIGREGREGKSVGTAFVIGDTKNVMKFSHQIILNPFVGHRQKDRCILDEKNWETVKELSQIDGMFIVSEDGIIEAAGRYIDVCAKSGYVQPGLGGRHVAASAISRQTSAVAIAVSASSGIVTVYKGGKALVQIDPRVAIY